MSRTYRINEKQMTFSCQKFKEVFRAYCESNKKRIGKQMEALATSLNVGCSTVENWYKRNNGPQDTVILKKLAAALEVDDYMVLLEEIDGGKKMYKLTDRQKDASKRIYDVLVWFLEEFRNSDGLSCFCDDEAFERLTQMQERVQLILSQECFDLHDQDVYYEFYDFFYEDLPKVYVGKVGTDNKPDPDDVWEDYGTAMQGLNEIVGRIV